MTERDLQRWSRQVAEDPGAPSFVLLARAYRREGRGEAARDVVLRGLEANPEHVDGHALLALIHLERGNRQEARDEWETVLRLDPGNFDASRGLGFLALERGDLKVARRHLDAAATARPEDPAVREALGVLERRVRVAMDGPTQPRPEPETSPASASASGRSGSGPSASGVSAPEEPASAPGGEPSPGGEAGRAAGTAVPRDPARLFASLASETPFRGALVLDRQGRLLAGRLEGGGNREELLAALLNTGLGEAERAATMLGLGSWKGAVLESGHATTHVSALTDGATVVLVAARDAPAGWVVRTAERAASLASRFLEEMP